MLNLLEEISAESQAETTTKREKADAAFVRMVASIVAGKKPSPEERNKVLTAANNSIDDLLAAVNFKLRRIEWAKIVATGPAIETEKATIAVKIDEARAVLNAAEDVFANMLAPHRHRLQELDESATQIGEAARRLRDTSDDAELLARDADIENEIHRLSSLHMRARNVLDNSAQPVGLELYPRPDPADVLIARADVARLDEELAEAVARKEQVTNELLEA